MKTIHGEPLYTLRDLAAASDVLDKTLRHWLEAGELTQFITIYESKKGRRYYRFGAPRHTETPLYGHVYDLETVVYRR